MHRTHVVVLVAAVAAVCTASAEAKFRISLAAEPARPVAAQRTVVTLRTGIVLPRRQHMSLIAVGPWRDETGEAVLDVPLVRIGSRAFRTTLRFPYAGRWRLVVVESPGSVPLPPVGLVVTVRPAR